MDTSPAAKLQDLIHQGDKLVPEGGLEFSGYNAKMQSQYLLWRKNSLDVLSKCGEKGMALRTQLANDENGAYFYQTSAQKVHEALKEALRSAEIAAPVPTPHSQPKQAAEPEQPKAPEPPKPPAPKTGTGTTNRVLVVSAANNPLLGQLTSLLKELGIEASVYQRTGGGSDALLSHVEKQPATHYAFYLIGSDDIPSAMFEMGYLVGKIGANKVCCIFQKDAAVPKNIPGVQRKEIIVKLEEISFSLVKELKAAGYSVSI
ncbi:MAG TPA: TIR domain-containing protein [Bacteroidota bacterium]|nr:TIR domain-containing protein [Bacteroidota bacterium]